MPLRDFVSHFLLRSKIFHRRMCGHKKKTSSKIFDNKLKCNVKNIQCTIYIMDNNYPPPPLSRSLSTIWLLQSKFYLCYSWSFFPFFFLLFDLVFFFLVIALRLLLNKFKQNYDNINKTASVYDLKKKWL